MPGTEPVLYTVRLLRRRVAGPGAPVFDFELPGRAVHRIGAADAKAAFRLRITNDRAWRALGSLDETRIGEAFLQGDLDFEGEVMAALDLRSSRSALIGDYCRQGLMAPAGGSVPGRANTAR